MNQKNAPKNIRGIVNLRKLSIGEKRQIGDFYLSPFGQLAQLEESPSFFRSKVSNNMVPHYRVSKITPFKENKIVKLIDNGKEIY